MVALSLSASASIAGEQADLALQWSAAASQPRSLRLVRRRRGTPVDPYDGDIVFDLADLFTDGSAGAGVPWGRVDRTRFLLGNPRAESSGVQAELVLYYAGWSDPQPKQVAVRIAPASPGAPLVSSILSVSRLASTTTTSTAFASIVTTQIFAQPPGATEQLAGTLVVSTRGLVAGPATTVLDYTQASGSGGPVTIVSQAAAASRLDWTVAGGGAATASVFFTQIDRPVTTAILESASPLCASFVTGSASPVQGASQLPLAVAGATGTPITIATGFPHGLQTGAWVSIAGVRGNTAANGTWSIAGVSPTSFTLLGSTCNGAYTPGSGMVYPPLLRSATFAESANILTGQIDRSLAVHDRAPDGAFAIPPAGLSAGTVYYFNAFQDTGAGIAAGNAAAASVQATGGAQFADRLYALLPAVHRFYDDPASGSQGSWQLRRYLQILGPALDQASSLAQSLPSLSDVFSTRSEYLPVLGATIGWDTDRTLPTERQRSDILFAPAVFATIGTLPNIEALANRATGWACQVKEFVNNVFLTNAAEPARLWQIMEASRGTATIPFTAPSLQAAVYALPAEPSVTQSDPTAVDARPAAAQGSGGTVWLFWHSQRIGSEWQASTAYAAGAAASVIAPLAAPNLIFECTTAGTSGASAPVFSTVTGATVADGTATWTCRGIGLRRRRIWLQRLGVDPVPVNAVADLQDAAGFYDEAPAVANLAGTIWLAWASNRNGSNEIWIRPWPSATAAPGAAQPLTRQRVDNRNPALVCAGTAGAPLSAFWECLQSGQSAIWTSISKDSGVTWSSATPVSPGPRDRLPTAALDSTGQVNLFWCADSGDSAHIRHGVQAAAGWTISDATNAVPGVHDAYPCAVLWNGAIGLFWGSNRFGAPWQPGTAYALGAIVAPAGGNGFWYLCSGSGTTSAAPPAFPAAAGATLADGSVTWTCGGTLANTPRARKNRIWLALGPGFATCAAAFAQDANDTQPAAVVEADGSLHLFFASQQSAARYRSRSFDTSAISATGREQIANAAAKAAIGTYVDRIHYTYDARRTLGAVFARDTIGLYLAPNDGQTDAQHTQEAARLRDFLTPFRPISARLTYFVQQSGSKAFVPIEVDP